MNASGSGLSLTQRTKWGSYGTRGFSLRTGIPGLYYQKRYRKKDGDITEIVVLVAAIVVPLAWAVVQAVLLVAFIIVRLLVIAALYLLAGTWEVTKWCALTSWDFSKYCFQEWHARRVQHRNPPVIADGASAVEVQNEHSETQDN